jgi:hypothetical protein
MRARGVMFVIFALAITAALAGSAIVIWLLSTAAVGVLMVGSPLLAWLLPISVALVVLALPLVRRLRAARRMNDQLPAARIHRRA